MRKREDRLLIGMKLAALGLPFLLGVTVAGAQTSGLVAPMSGDCTTSATGAVVCTKTNGVTLANSATTDTTNAANITSGTLPLAQVPALTGAKLPAGAPGTMLSYNSAGVQAPAVAAPYAATAGPIKVAPFSVSAMTSAGTLIGPTSGATSYRIANITNGARLLTTGAVSQVKTYIGTTTGATALYFELWRVNASGTFNLVCRSQNLLSSVTASATNTFAITPNCNAQAGDYPAMYIVGSFSGATPFSSSTAYTAAAYPTYAASGAQLSSTEDFLGGTTGATYTAVQNAPIEVYLAKGPVLVGMGDSKMQGIPFSGDYLQAAGNYAFPVAAQTTYSTATNGTSLIDLSNQPIAWAARTLGYTFANLGITGSTSTTQLSYELPTALALKPAVLVISGTINDSAFNVTTSTSLSNYTAMYNQAIAAGVQKVVMTGVEPAGYTTEAVWANTSYGGDALNAALKSFCQAQTACVWVGDQVSAALGQYRTGGAAGTLHNIQPSYAAADNLHFNNAGAQAMGLIEANAIETPASVGTTIAVPNAFGTATRSRAAVAVSHDGTLGWRWQDTRDFLQMDTQGLDNAALSAGSAQQGQQTIGCVTFASGKGYVRCDGTFTWSQQNSALTVPTLYATTISGPIVNGGVTHTKVVSPVDMAVTGTDLNITSMTSTNSAGGAGIGGTSSNTSNVYYPFLAWGSGAGGGLGGTFGTWDASLSKMMVQYTKSGRICWYAAYTPQGVTTYGGSTAENGCPTTSGMILYPSGILAPQNVQSQSIVSGATATLTSATTALPTTAQVITVNLAANYAPTWAAPVGTPAVTLRLCQNSTGGYTFTPASNMKGFTGATTTASQCTRWQAQYFADTATWEAMGAGVSY